MTHKTQSGPKLNRFPLIYISSGPFWGMGLTDRQSLRAATVSAQNPIPPDCSSIGLGVVVCSDW